MPRKIKKGGSGLSGKTPVNNKNSSASSKKSIKLASLSGSKSTGGRAKPATYKQPSIVSGMSVSDILNMSESRFNKLTERELKLVVGRLVSAVNKRVRRFEKAGITTPATRALEKSGGKLSVKGKSLNELRSEYARARNFLNMETSTRKGYEQVQKKISETLRERGYDISPNELDDMFEVYNDLLEIDPSLSMSKDRYLLMQEIANMPDDLDVSEKVLKAKERYTELYEQEQMELNGKEVDLYGVSGFFEI